MLRAEPDPGTTRITRVTVEGNSSFYWVPMFAVNDWESTTKVFREVRERTLPQDCRTVIALNNRADRTDRASMFVDVVTEDLDGEFDRAVLYGEIQDVVRQKLINAGLPEDRIVMTTDLDDADGKDLVQRAREGFAEDEDVAIFGMVNIHTRHVESMERYVHHLVEGSLHRTEVTVP